jgi:hypothetical protein
MGGDDDTKMDFDKDENITFETTKGVSVTSTFDAMGIREVGAVHAESIRPIHSVVEQERERGKGVLSQQRESAGAYRRHSQSAWFQPSSLEAYAVKPRFPSLCLHTRLVPLQRGPPARAVQLRVRETLGDPAARHYAHLQRPRRNRAGRVATSRWLLGLHSLPGGVRLLTWTIRWMCSLPYTLRCPSRPAGVTRLVT